jgi:hypothetical protein
MPDLDGVGLQLYINEALPALREEVWAPDVQAAVTSASCEVCDHGRGLVTYAEVGNSYAVSLGQWRWPPSGATPADYDVIRDRTPDGIKNMIRDHLRHMTTQIKLAVERHG